MTAVPAIGRAAIMDPVIGALETTDQGIEALVIVDRVSVDQMIVVPPDGDQGNVVPMAPIADPAIVVPVSAAEAIRAVRAAGWVAAAPAADREWGGSVQ